MNALSQHLSTLLYSALGEGEGEEDGEGGGWDPLDQCEYENFILKQGLAAEKLSSHRILHVCVLLCVCTIVGTACIAWNCNHPTAKKLGSKATGIVSQVGDVWDQALQQGHQDLRRLRRSDYEEIDGTQMMQPRDDALV